MWTMEKVHRVSSNDPLFTIAIYDCQLMQGDVSTYFIKSSALLSPRLGLVAVASSLHCSV